MIDALIFLLYIFLIFNTYYFIFRLFSSYSIILGISTANPLQGQKNKIVIFLNIRQYQIYDFLLYTIKKRNMGNDGGDIPKRK